MSELHWILYTGAVGLIVIGLTGMVVMKNVFRVILGLVIAEAGANLLLVIAGYRFDAVAPILTSLSNFDSGVSMVDPVPQAMVLTAIVIGVGIQALALALIIRVVRHYRTLDMREIHQRLLDDINAGSEVTSLSSAERPAHQEPRRGINMEQTNG